MTTPIYPDPIPEHQTPMPDPSVESTFGARMRSLFDWFVGVFQPSANLMAQQTYQNAMAAAESAESAQAVAGVAMWAAATNYVTGSSAISPSTYQTYRRKSPGGVDATDPALSALWEEIGGTRVKRTGDEMSGNLKFAGSASIGSDLMRFGGQYKNAIFQTTYPNTATHVGAKPSGTGTSAGFFANNGSANEFFSFRMGELAAVIEAGKDTTGGTSYRPIQLWTGGLQRLTVDAAGQVVISGTNMILGAAAYPANVVSGFYTPNGVSAGGFRCHQGVLGAFSPESYNLYWTGSAMQAWIGTTNLGNFTISSDYRIKKNVRDLEGGAIARVMQLRPVSYELADFKDVFRADGRVRVGFIAHELAGSVPSAVDGEKDDPEQVQSLRLDPVVAELTKAFQEMVALNEALTARVAALEGSQ